MKHRDHIIAGAVSFFLFIFLILIPTAFAEAQIPEKKIALTFDDGPYGVPTIQILDILKKENVHATFFVMGENVEKYPDIAKAIVADGNIIENHTYDHPKNLVSLSPKDFIGELSKTENAIATATSEHPDLFRAPYGKTSPRMLEEIKNEGYVLVPWTIDTLDWNYPKSTPDLIVKKVVKEAKPNGIILMHDGRDTHLNYPRDNTITALPKVIDALRKEGYTFVTADQLIGKKAYF